MLFLLVTLQFTFSYARKLVWVSRPIKSNSTQEDIAVSFQSPSSEFVYDEKLASTHAVKDLPGLPFGYHHAMYAGEISVMEPRLRNDGTLYYWLLESQYQPEKAPLVMWINGGPGCSSLEGLLIEHGPFLAVDTGFDLELNAYSWNKHANMIYLDQPVGTGFASVSGGKYANSQEEVNIMFMAFLRRWIRMYPQYKGRPFFLAGESYAGRFIPHFAHQILQAGLGMNLQGVMIGNGWTHPMVQSESFPDFSFSQGLVSTRQKDYMNLVLAECRARYDADPYSHETHEE
jgi:carboxypeptidase C (cathepsin A)